MEKQKIKEALNLDIFLQSLLDLTESSDESSEDDEVNEVLSASMQTLPNSYYFPEDKSRQWLKDLLLEEDNLESDDENIDEVIKIHKMILTYREQFHSDPSLSKYMYYSSDFITGENKWPSHFQTITKKLLKRKAQLNKQSRAKSSLSPTLNDQNVSTTSFVSRSYQHRVKSHAVNDKITHGNLVKKRAFSVSRRKSMNMAALRRYIWKIIVKKEIPKAYRQRVQNQSNKLALLKKASKDAAKKIRAKALESRMRCRKEVVVARARRMTREAQLFWKKYVRVEKTHRRQAEKEAITQKRIEDEKREAHKQEQKLKFLITQTELYAQFVSGKPPKNTSQENQALNESLEKDDQSTEVDVVSTSICEDDNLFSKERAYETANAAYRLHKSKLKMYTNAPSILKEQGEKNLNSGTDAVQPKLLHGRLTGYQLVGVNWLCNLYRHGLNGILADDMGLGKTVQTIAFLAILAENYDVWGPFLVIAPASTLNNWHQEFSRFLPAFKVLPYWGTTAERKVLRLFWNQKVEEKSMSATPFHVLITSYQLATTDLRYFQKISWHYIVFDEAHALKSSNSIRWRTLLDFSCRNRLLLTGTPVQNTMSELWALLHFIMPSLFDDHVEFNDWFAKNIENYVDSKSSIDGNDLTRLHGILKPFILRRLKCDVEHELTEKVEVRVLCQLSPRQKILYEALQKNILVKELLRARSCSSQSSNNIVLMNLVMQFRKVCNHPDIFHCREILSPFFHKAPTYILPRLIFNSFLSPTSHRKNSSKFFYSDLNIHNPINVHRSLNESADINYSSFSFLRFIGRSPSQHWKIFTGNLSDRIDLFEEVRAKRNADVHYELFRTNTQSPYVMNSRKYAKEHLEILHKHELSRISLWIPNFIDFYCLANAAESIMSELFFVKISQKIISHFNHTVTCLTNDKSAALSPSKKFPTNATNRHRMVYSARSNVATDILSIFTKICLPKAQCISREIYCDDINALRFIKRQNGCLKDFLHLYDFPAPMTVRVPDHELLVTDSGKLSALDMLLQRLKDGGHRVLIYSQMTKMIDILEEYMIMRRHIYVRLDGSTRISSRRDTVAGFQSCDEIFVFLLSTRAGGVGINLTAADTVIFYDSDWNPTVDQQAMDRAHRLGQTKQVTVYRLVCKGTVDERILARAEAKSTIQRMVIQGGSFNNEPLNRTEMVSLLLDDDHIAKASQSDEVLKSSLETADLSRKRKYRRKSNQANKNRKIHTKSDSTNKNDKSNINSVQVTQVGDSNNQVLVVDDDCGSTVTAATSTATNVIRGQKKRGRPRLRPIKAAASTRVTSRNPVRSRLQGVSKRGRGSRGGRRGRSFFGRAAAMAGARAGALAAAYSKLGSSSFPT